MTYVATSFKDFVRHKLNEETIKASPVEIPAPAKSKGRVWMDEIVREYEEIMKDYDNLYEQPK